MNINNDMNINIHFDIKLILISRHTSHTMPPPVPSADGPGMVCVWGDINIHIEIIINMSRQYWYPQAPPTASSKSTFRHTFLEKVGFR